MIEVLFVKKAQIKVVTRSFRPCIRGEGFLFAKVLVIKIVKPIGGSIMEKAEKIQILQDLIAINTVNGNELPIATYIQQVLA